MTLKVGIENYSYHRFFGEVYPQQETPDQQMTIEDFLNLKQADVIKLDTRIDSEFPVLVNHLELFQASFGVRRDKYAFRINSSMQGSKQNGTGAF